MKPGPYSDLHEKIERSFLRATGNAMLEAKRKGQSIPIMRDGKLIHLPAEEIPDPFAEPAAPKGSQRP